MAAFARRVLAGAFLIAVGLAISGCAPTYWWTYQNDARHTGYVRGGVSPSPRPLWAVPLGASSGLTAPVFGAIGDTFRVFIGSGYGDKTLYALHPQTGAVLWSFQAQGSNGFFGAASAVDGVVYTATRGLSPEVYALDQGTGSVVWHTPLPVTGTSASIAVDAGRIFVITDVHQLLSLDAATGAILWSVPTSPVPPTGQVPLPSSPVAFLDRVYVGADDGLYAFRASTGAFVWKYAMAAAAGMSSPVLALDAAVPLVLISDESGVVHAVDAVTGIRSWTWQGGGSLGLFSVAAAEGRVFTTSLANAVALDLASGSVLWQRPLFFAVKSPAVGGRVVYYCDGNDVVGLDTATGSPVWKGSVAGTIGTKNGDLAIALEILVVPNRGAVHAFK